MRLNLNIILWDILSRKKEQADIKSGRVDCTILFLVGEKALSSTRNLRRYQILV
jgi:hypothetical protein